MSLPCSNACNNSVSHVFLQDGCFDMMHYGHANALRQAKACGDVLVVGLIPDSEIAAVKGPPVMNEQERLAMVESIKWVDEVVTDVPYNLTAEFLHELFTKHNIDFVVHGDDPCFLPDGTDAYAEAKRCALRYSLFFLSMSTRPSTRDCKPVQLHPFATLNPIKLKNLALRKTKI